MKELEIEFNKKCDLAFKKLKEKHKSKLTFGNPLTDMVNNMHIYSQLMKETNGKVVEIVNSIYDESQKKIAITLAQNKMREFLPEMKSFIGL